jgi:hypothetical protein
MNDKFSLLQLFFQERALPRRTRDAKAEELQFKKTQRRTNIYRRVGPDEHDRGELYPIIHSGMDTFAHFGVGIGIYFAQLVILTGVTFLCGMVMLTAVNEYQKDEYHTEQRLPFSAACMARNVTATVNCPNGEESCIRLYRSCELPYNAAAADIAMCIIFCLAIIFSKYIEAKIEQKLDESVQTAKDYSVEVLDPDGNADDPTRWHEYFSQFGNVKYITILRRNNELTDLILKKHSVVRKIQESGRLSSKAKAHSLHRQYEKVENEIKRALQKTYPVCKVFVTFDSEKDQHQCLNELEVPDYQALFDFKSKAVNASYVFGDNVLDVREPPEPDNILWQNLAVGKMKSRFRNVQAFLAYVGILAVLWYLVKAVRDNIPDLLGLLVGIVDSILPTIFDYLTDFQHPRSEGSKQTSLQTRLFCARFLLSTIIPYLTADWNAVITPQFIVQILTVQIAACFTAPLMDLTDWYGLFMRHYYSAIASDTQEEMNSFWVGSYWSIAEKYTGIAKVIFVSLFYALLTPISLLIATVAFVVIFLIDNYLLLRRWKVASMLDSTIASRLRRQAILSICAHMFVTMRFIYSWPMDDVFWNGATFEVVDKSPPYNFLTIQIQPWMSEGQKHIFYSYKTLLILVCLTTLHILILQPFGQWMFNFLCKSIRIAGEMDSMKFSSVESIRIYYPMLRYQEEQYLCSFAKNVLPRHRPVLIDSNNIMKDDLSVYIPVESQKKVLSIVQYFGVDPIEQYEEKKIIDVDDLQTLASKTLPKPKSKKVLAVSMKDSMSTAWYQMRLSMWKQQDAMYFRATGKHLTKPKSLSEPPRTYSRAASMRSSFIVPVCDSPDELMRMGLPEDDVEMNGGNGSRYSRTPTPTNDFRALVRRVGDAHAPHSDSFDATEEYPNSNKSISPAAVAAVKAFRAGISPKSNRPSPNSSPALAAFKKAAIMARANSKNASPASLSPASIDSKTKSFFPNMPTDTDQEEAKGDNPLFSIIFEGDNEDDISAKPSPLTKNPPPSSGIEEHNQTNPSQQLQTQEPLSAQSSVGKISPRLKPLAIAPSYNPSITLLSPTPRSSSAFVLQDSSPFVSIPSTTNILTQPNQLVSILTAVSPNKNANEADSDIEGPKRAVSPALEVNLHHLTNEHEHSTLPHHLNDSSSLMPLLASVNHSHTPRTPNLRAETELPDNSELLVAGPGGGDESGAGIITSETNTNNEEINLDIGD